MIERSVNQKMRKRAMQHWTINAELCSVIFQQLARSFWRS